MILLLQFHSGPHPRTIPVLPPAHHNDLNIILSCCLIFHKKANIYSRQFKLFQHLARPNSGITLLWTSASSLRACTQSFRVHLTIQEAEHVLTKTLTKHNDPKVEKLEAPGHIQQVGHLVMYPTFF